MHKILLAEDDFHLRFAYTRYLEKAGFDVVATSNGEHAFEEFLKVNFDLVIADIMMPIVDGNALVDKIRHINQTIPILMLTALDGISDKEKSYDLGADDYLSKPFEMKELVLRINALLKRSKPAKSAIITIGQSVIDAKKHQVLIKGKEIKLTRKEFALLFKLLSNPDHLFTREALLNEFWGHDTDSYDRTVDTHIATLRRKCKSPDFEIKTVFGHGYKGIISEKKDIS